MDSKVLRGGKWDSEKAEFHWINLIEANGIFCHSLFYQVQKKYFKNIKLILKVFPKGGNTTVRLGTCWKKRNQINLYCRSLKVFIHEICHFEIGDHNSNFINFMDEMMDYAGDLIPVTYKEKVRMSVGIIKNKIEGFIYFDEDQEILNMIEISARVNRLDMDDLLDTYFN
jgi:hypothetical protein